MDINIVEIWLRRDPVRWLAGGLAGALAGVAALIFGSLLSVIFGQDPLFPVKLGAVIFLGGSAMELGMTPAVLIGFATFEAICIFFGALYAHFTGTNNMTALLGVGFTWGAFSWVFLNNLFSPSFEDFYVVGVSSGAAFFVCMVYGFSLTSVAFFDRILRKR